MSEPLNGGRHGRQLLTVEARLDLLEDSYERARDRDDELLGAVRDLGERIRGTHGVATDAVSGVNSLHMAVTDLRSHLGAVQLAVEVLVKRKTRGPAALARKTRRRKS